MADGFAATDAAGNTVSILTDQVTDGTLGTGQKQLVGIVDATLDSVNKLIVDSSGRAKVLADGSTVAVSTTPAASRNTDSVSAALAVDALMSGLTAVTPQYAKIVASASGVTTIVSAVSSKQIVVLAWDVTASAAVNFKWQSHVTPTDLTGLYYTGVTGGIARGFNPVGYFRTIAGEALDINLSGAVAVGGSLVYIVL